MDIRQKFGSRLRELRKRAGLTQAQLAARCGKNVEMQNVGEIERGERNCTLQTIEKLARALKVEPAALFLFRPQQVGKSLSLLPLAYPERPALDGPWGRYRRVGKTGSHIQACAEAQEVEWCDHLTQS